MKEEQQQHLTSTNINEIINSEMVAEVLGRLDGRSLAAAACVCRLWASVGRRDTVWEAVCLRHVSPARHVTSPGCHVAPAGTRAVVAAMGGYRRLYRLCVGPALDRLNGPGRAGWAGEMSLSLWLSLFSIDCYERLGVAGAGAGGRQRPASLLFLSSPVDVS